MNIVDKYYKETLEPTMHTMSQRTTIFEFDVDFVKYIAGPLADGGDVYVSILRNDRPIQTVDIERYKNGVRFSPALQVGDVVKIVYDAIRYGR